MARYVVSFPPVMVNRPGGSVKTAWFRGQVAGPGVAQLLVLAQQRAQPRPGRHHVALGHAGEVPGHRRQDVVAVGGVDRRVVQVARVGRVGRPGVHPVLPRDDEDVPPVVRRRRGDQRRRGPDRARGEHQVHALARQQPHAAPAAPPASPAPASPAPASPAPASRVTRSAQTPAALTTALARTSNRCPVISSATTAPVTRPSPRSSVTRAWLASSAPDACAVRATSMVSRASSTWHSKYRKPRDRAAEPGDGLADLPGADRPVVADVPARRQQLVPGQPDPVRGPAAQVAGQHVHRHRPDQVRRQPEQDAPLPQRLPDQAELAMLQVAQAAVHQPGGTSRGPGREVVLLHQGHRQPARRGVQGDADAGDPAPDDQHVEPVLGHPGEVGGAGLGGERQHQPMVTPHPAPRPAPVP